MRALRRPPTAPGEAEQRACPGCRATAAKGRVGGGGSGEVGVAVVRQQMEAWKGARMEAAVGVWPELERRGCWVWMVAGGARCGSLQMWKKNNEGINKRRIKSQHQYYWKSLIVKISFNICKKLT